MPASAAFGRSDGGALRDGGLAQSGDNQTNLAIVTAWLDQHGLVSTDLAGKPRRIPMAIGWMLGRGISIR
jgi:hypothetical protein